jgi:hypothetical protein
VPSAPRPRSRVFTDTEGHPLPADPAAPFVAQVWRTSVDTFLASSTTSASSPAR